MQEPDPHIVKLAKQADDAKLNMAAVLRDAGVQPSTWFRWRQGQAQPTLGKLRRVEEAIGQALTRDCGVGAMPGRVTEIPLTRATRPLVDAADAKRLHGQFVRLNFPAGEGA